MNRRGCIVGVFFCESFECFVFASVFFLRVFLRVFCVYCECFVYIVSVLYCVFCFACFVFVSVISAENVKECVNLSMDRI
jgi:hypothetical protein